MANRNNIYIIPDNFIEGGKVFNGMFKIRNLIEAAVLVLLLSIPLFAIPYPSIQVQITVMIVVLLPVLMFAVMGINDDSLIEFIQNLVRWKQNKRIILYNGNVRPRHVRTADVLEAQELPKDKLITAMDNFRERRKQAQAEITYVEGVDFEFIEDSDRNSVYMATEKRLLEEKQNKSKKSKKNDKLLMLAEKNTEDAAIFEIDNSECDIETEIVEEGDMHVE